MAFILSITEDIKIHSVRRIQFFNVKTCVICSNKCIQRVSTYSLVAEKFMNDDDCTALWIYRISSLDVTVTCFAHRAC